MSRRPCRLSQVSRMALHDRLFCYESVLLGSIVEILTQISKWTTLTLPLVISYRIAPNLEMKGCGRILFASLELVAASSCYLTGTFKVAATSSPPLSSSLPQTVCEKHGLPNHKGGVEFSSEKPSLLCKPTDNTGYHPEFGWPDMTVLENIDFL